MQTSSEEKKVWKMLVRASLRSTVRLRRVNGRACPSQLLLHKYITKEDLVSLTQSFCNGSCKPLFPRLRDEDCCVDIQNLVNYAIQTNSQLLRILLVHNVAELDLELLLETCVEQRNRNAFRLISDLLDPLTLDEIGRNLGLTGNTYFLRSISYRLPALQGLIEGGYFDAALAYAKYHGVTESELEVEVFENMGGKVHVLDVLHVLALPDTERYRLLSSTIHTQYLSGVKYLAYKNSRLDLRDLLALPLSSAAVDALRDCLPRLQDE